jgi:hypothetical protein
MGQPCWPGIEQVMLYVGACVIAQAMEDYWLGSTHYVAGEQISIADLPILCELDELELLVGATQVHFNPNAHAHEHDMSNPSGETQAVQRSMNASVLHERQRLAAEQLPKAKLFTEKLFYVPSSGSNNGAAAGRLP